MPGSNIFLINQVIFGKHLRIFLLFRILFFFFQKSLLSAWKDSSYSDLFVHYNAMLSDSKSSGISTHTPEKIGMKEENQLMKRRVPSPVLLVLEAMKLDAMPYSSLGNAIRSGNPKIIKMAFLKA